MGGIRAAIVTGCYHDARGAVTDETPVDLRVTLQVHERQGAMFSGPEGFIDAEHVFQDSTGAKPGTWREPPKVHETAQKPSLVKA